MRTAVSYLTEDELQAAMKLHQRAPYALCNVSQGSFSIARHYGGLVFKDCRYSYIDGHDECVRDDVLKMVTKMRKSMKAPPESAAVQLDAFQGVTE